jgi:hypothetical protein
MSSKNGCEGVHFRLATTLGVSVIHLRELGVLLLR